MAQPAVFTSITGRAPRLTAALRLSRLSAAARLRRIAAVLAAAASGVLAWAAVPAAAAIIPVPGPAGTYGATQAAPPPSQPITTGGMPGWQITLIAITAALLAATAAVTMDRARARRRTASTTG
jgi:hypothetical protein